MSTYLFGLYCVRKLLYKTRFFLPLKPYMTMHLLRTPIIWLLYLVSVFYLWHTKINWGFITEGELWTFTSLSRFLTVPMVTYDSGFILDPMYQVSRVGRTRKNACCEATRNSMKQSYLSVSRDKHIEDKVRSVRFPLVDSVPL